MKKILLLSAFAALTLVACKKEENKIEQPITNAPTESVNDAPDSVAEDNGNTGIPRFRYAEADQFAQEYGTFVNDYKFASMNNDKEGLKSLGLKLNDFQKRAVELAKRVPQQEAVAFQDFVSKLETYLK